MITVRLATEGDKENFLKWFEDRSVLRYYPMCNDREVEDAVRNIMTYAKNGSVLVAEVDGKPCGFGNLYIQPFKKLSHQCLFSILVDKEYRGQGVGTKLMEEMEKLGKEKFGLEFLHLEVYEGNPAQRLYDRFGYKEYGHHEHFLKEKGEYITKIMMQKKI